MSITNIYDDNWTEEYADPSPELVEYLTDVIGDRTNMSMKFSVMPKPEDEPFYYGCLIVEFMIDDKTLVMPAIISHCLNPDVWLTPAEYLDQIGPFMDFADEIESSLDRDQ